MKRCTLCGGKLNSSKRCTFCGLDNTKNDEAYRHMINRNTCEDMPLTHIHEEPVKSVPKKAAVKPAGQVNAQVYKTPVQKTYKKKNTNPAGCLAAIFTVIPFVIVFLGIASSIFDNVGVGVEEIIDEQYEQIVVEPDDYFSYSTGAGYYEAGVDIPTGDYYIVLEDGFPNMIDVYDEAGDLCHSEFLDGDYEMEISLFEGYTLVIPEDTYVFMETFNAQSYE